VQFALHPLYAETLRYAHDATGQSASQRATIWQQDIVGTDGTLQALLGTVPAPYLQPALAATTSNDPAIVACMVDDMQRLDLPAIVARALHSAAGVLPGPQLPVYLAPFWSTLGGAQPNGMLLLISETHPQARPPLDILRLLWAAHAGHLADHEYFVAVRTQAVGADQASSTLLDQMVTAGMAEAFAQSQVNGFTACTYLPTSQEKTLWQQIQPQLDSAKGTIPPASVMYGDSTQNIPQDTGTCIGYHLVERYLHEHSGTSWTQLAGMGADQVNEGSGYSG
jgi:hypothetical protein